MESTKTATPPVLSETRVINEFNSIIFPIVFVDNNRNDIEFKRKAADAERRYEQLWVCGNSRKVAEISREIDTLKIEARENGYDYKFKY